MQRAGAQEAFEAGSVGQCAVSVGQEGAQKQRREGKIIQEGCQKGAGPRKKRAQGRKHDDDRSGAVGLRKRMCPEVIRSRGIDKNSALEVVKSRRIDKSSVPEVVKSRWIDKSSVPGVVKSRCINKTCALKVVRRRWKMRTGVSRSPGATGLRKGVSASGVGPTKTSFLSLESFICLSL